MISQYFITHLFCDAQKTHSSFWPSHAPIFRMIAMAVSYSIFEMLLII
jgi:hypothetical protein